jgi:replication-associated recombination protein RarA
MPPALIGTVFYQPTERGFEQKLGERLEWLRKRRAESQPADSKSPGNEASGKTKE